MTNLEYALMPQVRRRRLSASFVIAIVSTALDLAFRLTAKHRGPGDGDLGEVLAAFVLPVFGFVVGIYGLLMRRRLVIVGMILCLAHAVGEIWWLSRDPNFLRGMIG